jgi:ribosomal protein S18 acetylase RimI-like enzyme
MTKPDVRTATAEHIDRCVAIIVLAFSGDPAARWAFADPQAYFAIFPRFVRAFGGKAFDQGTAHHVVGCAAALWIPPGVEPDEKTMVGLIESAVPECNRESVFSVLEQMATFHPKEPHWYLPLIGTDPSQQGKGYGSALLRHALTVCDRQKLPAYLEATSPRNVPFYRRHGFEVVGTVQAGNSPTITPMLREPH